MRRGRLHLFSAFQRCLDEADRAQAAVGRSIQRSTRRLVEKATVTPDPNCVTVILRPGDQPIAGCVRVGDQPVGSFTGWLQMLSALEVAIDAVQHGAPGRVQ
jgi:hypothetical protein